jgi:hypothetical protein
MRLRRRQARLALLVVACALAVGGVIAAVGLTNDVHESTGAASTALVAPTAPGVPSTPVAPARSVVRTTGIAPTTGDWTPITVIRPKVPIIAGGIPVDVDPTTSRTDFSTTLFPLGANRYRMTVFNTSTLGAVNSFQWYPPPDVRVVKVIGSSRGRCTRAGLTGFGGNQFRTIVLYPNIFCEQVDLKPATCTCRGDGGAVTITFVTNKGIAVDAGDLRLRTATVAFDPISTTPPVKSAQVRHIKRIVPPAGSSGGLTSDERAGAQSALDSLQDSNISLQLVTITTRWAQSVPTACRVALESRSPRTYRVYVFWTPWLAAVPYVWLTMNVTADPRTSTFQLGTSETVLPGGRLVSNGRKVNRLSVDTTLLSRYGAEQAQKGHELLVAQGGDVFTKPGAGCQVLKNGSLRLVPN